MKKPVSLLFALALLLQTAPVRAFADIVIPGKPYTGPVRPPEPKGFPVLPVLLIAVAVIVICVVIWKRRRKRK